VQAWEQGRREPQKMARRLLDEIADDPKRWIKRLENAARSRKVAV
jgi:DNA-binding transcriptional regulator YiaG